MSLPRHYFPKPRLILFESRALPVEFLKAPLLPPRVIPLFELVMVPSLFGTRPGSVVFQTVGPLKSLFLALGLALVASVARCEKDV